MPKETADGERRVALVPDAVRSLADKEIESAVEAGAGEAAGYPDEQYAEAGGAVGSADDAWGADVVLRVAVPTTEEIGRLRRDQVLIGHLAPLTSPDTNRALADAGVTSFAMEAIPRITRAQAMDALSSQANLAGYAAALLAAREAGRLFPMMTTAAGTIAPARVLVLGAGVAGLQAIATAKRLGAVVTGFDIRRAAWEQIASLGAENAVRQDVIITTAQIPGRRAPILITAEAVRKMSPGSVVVDLAGESGGNCELTRAGETVVEDGVKVIAPANLPSEMAKDASQLYAKNIENLLGLLADDEGNLKLDFDDEIVAGACITHDGEIRNERAREAQPVSA